MSENIWLKFFWVWVVAGIVFASLVICLIFLLINKCISRSGKHRISQLNRGNGFKIESNKYQERDFKADIPPLPPRTQFLTQAAQSYENLAEVPDYEQSVPDYEQDVGDYEQCTPDYVESTPDYVESTHDYEESTPDYVESTHDYEESTPDYVESTPDYVESTPDYEESTPDYVESTPDYEQDLPDYVKVDDEEKILLSPPPYQDPDPSGDNTSTEDYDDIGEDQGEEDYDDVG
ncbi:DNA-directed RNA polymerase II subunit RPB1 [Dicentrarchus labrax]|uniref:DNA-directed RNA polymerase II subunit RPB1 n=1 Tax=Dicentrarchus labrax TaxID=13489 RepID=UPI0021F61919|nr:DNA-directed RNA polymerase II subunit RPB1 [Dicentrarchus labrax]